MPPPNGPELEAMVQLFKANGVLVNRNAPLVAPVIWHQDIVLFVLAETKRRPCQVEEAVMGAKVMGVFDVPTA
jgi:hypothetical protein